MLTTKDFEDYLDNNLESVKLSIAAEEAQERQAFLEEFPIERLQSITAEEYCLGTEHSKESFCYLIEFGKYGRTGFGIGGGTSKKYGVYYSKGENCFKHGDQKIDNIEEFWPKFRNQLCQFIIESGTSDHPLVLENYPLLQGMAMVITKLLCLYYPDKYISIGSSRVLRDLMNYFGFAYEKGIRCHQSNFYYSRNIRESYPVLYDADGFVIGRLSWRFIDGESKKTRKGSPKEQKETGLGDNDIEETHYWIYSPGTNASKWDEFSSEGVMGIGFGELGNLSSYVSRTDMQIKMQELGDPNQSYKNDSLATWQFANVLKPGDIVYAKKGAYKLVGRGVVTSDYYYEEVDDEYKNFREIDWTDVGEWPHPGKAVMKTLTDITSYTDYVEQLEELFAGTEEEPANEQEKNWPPYSKEKFLDEVYIDDDSYNTLVGLIRNKKNVILQGAPGVGKTFAANRLAYSIMGEKNKDRVMMVQFHQSYSYEDFIEGFRPASDSDGFEIKKGSFYKFCKKAADDADHEYFFIIDEINRGNLSKIFGELFMLIEKDKRGNSLQLLYSDEKFYVPGNVYIIGMMNTADRSLAMLDYALRRRFAFFEMKPAFDQDKFIEYRQGLDNSKFNSLIDCVKRLNERIKEDSSLGEGFCIGHSYFCDLKEVTDETLSNIVEYELIPLLKEYWFDDQANVRDWSEKLRSAIK